MTTVHERNPARTGWAPGWLAHPAEPGSAARNVDLDDDEARRFVDDVRPASRTAGRPRIADELVAADRDRHEDASAIARRTNERRAANQAEDYQAVDEAGDRIKE